MWRKRLNMCKPKPSTAKVLGFSVTSKQRRIYCFKPGSYVSPQSTQTSALIRFGGLIPFKPASRFLAAS
jgi:hypothetical protein